MDLAEYQSLGARLREAEACQEKAAKLHGAVQMLGEPGSHWVTFFNSSGKEYRFCVDSELQDGLVALLSVQRTLTMQKFNEL